MTDKQVVINDLITHYIQSGSSEKYVLLLHGWGDNAKTFTDLQKFLSVKYSVVSVDLPGFGNTDAPKETWGLRDYSDFVGAFVAKIGIKPDVVIGHSNGGAIAIKGIAEGVIASQQLVLLSSAGIRDTNKTRKKLTRLAAKTAKLLTKPLPKSMQNNLKKKAYSAIGSDLFVAEHLQETFKKVVSDDVQPDARKIHIPTLLIYGDQDTATPVGYGQTLHDCISGSKFEVIPGVGHFVHHDASDKVCQLVGDFIV